MKKTVAIAAPTSTKSELQTTVTVKPNILADIPYISDMTDDDYHDDSSSVVKRLLMDDLDDDVSVVKKVNLILLWSLIKFKIPKINPTFVTNNTVTTNVTTISEDSEPERPEEVIMPPPKKV